MPVFDGCLAGFLPAAACQCQAKSAGVTLGHPGKLGPVPQGIFQGRVGSGAFDQAADPALYLGRAGLGGLHHPGYLAVAGRFGRLGGRHPRPGRGGQGIVHLAGQFGAALAVLCHQRVGVGDQCIGVHGAVGGYVISHQLPGPLVQPGQVGHILTPRLCRQLHLRPLTKPAAPAPAAPGP